MSDIDPPAHPEPTLPASIVTSSNDGEKKALDPSKSRALSNAPSEIQSTIAKADQILLRLNKQLKTTAGLGSALSILNYSLYTAGYIHAQSPSRAVVIAYISRLVGRTPNTPKTVLPAAGVSPFAALGSVISDTRTTLRLTGLIPLVIWLKSLLSKRGSQGVDPVIHRVALVQCISYIAFQFIENVYHLAGKGVVSPQFIANRGGMMKWVNWSCRAWMVGVISDFARLWREAALAKEKRRNGEIVSIQEQKEFNQRWWADFVTATAWMPVALQYSLVSGIPGMNMGIIGLCGVLANLNNIQSAWAATK